MILDRPASDRLAELLEWKGPARQSLSWERVEQELGIAVPSGIRELARCFPSGSFGGQIHFYNPVQGHRALASFLGSMRSKGGNFRYARGLNFEEFPYRFHPEPGGLVAWGHGDQHTYFWRPDSGDNAVLFCDDHGAGWGEYSGDVPHFLLDLFSDHIESRVLYEGWAEFREYHEFSDFVPSGPVDSWKEK